MEPAQPLETLRFHLQDLRVRPKRGSRHSAVEYWVNKKQDNRNVVLLFCFPRVNLFSFSGYPGATGGVHFKMPQISAADEVMSGGLGGGVQKVSVFCGWLRLELR